MFVAFSEFCVLFVCKYLLYYRQRVSTQLQLYIYNIYTQYIYTYIYMSVGRVVQSV
jgi:hypothetical protein